MTTVPSLRRWVRCSVRVKASRSASLSGLGRSTSGPASQRASGVWPVSQWIVAVIAVLGPGLGRFVQELEREVGDALEHRHQLSFDRGP